MIFSSQLMTDIMKANPDQMIYMFKQLSNITVYLEKRIQMNSISSASDRVIMTLAIWLYDMGLDFKGEMAIPHPLTINELAQVAGTTRETAGKVVKQLTKQDLISFTRQGIYYKDQDYFYNLIRN